MIDYCWNGIGITTPPGWEPAALEKDGFLLEDQGRPVCELKWRTIQGRFSFDKHLGKLSKGNKGVTMAAVSLDEAPPVWTEAAERLMASGLQLQSFLWSLDDIKGMGAALHNPATGLAVLIQFFMDGATDAVAAEVLASFRDHSAGKTVPWAMFGLAARVPAGFVLDTFSFKPGHYTVKYWRPKSAAANDRVPTGKGPGTSLVFERFAPASVLLKGTTLEAWARATLDGGVPDSLPVVVGSDALAWSGIDKPSLLRAFLRRQRHAMGHVRIVESANAVLAVRAQGVVPLDPQAFKAVRESYAVV